MANYRTMLSRLIPCLTLLFFGGLSCSSLEPLPCKKYGYGVVEIVNRSGETKQAAYCRTDTLAEGEKCTPQFTSIIPGPWTKRLRLQPGVYEIVIWRWDGDKKVADGWEVTVQQCKSVYFFIDRIDNKQEVDPNNLQPRREKVSP
jgi:hypothetical protein